MDTILFLLPVLIIALAFTAWSAAKPEYDSDTQWSERELEAGFKYRFLKFVFSGFSWVVGLLIIFFTLGSFQNGSRLGNSIYWIAFGVAFFVLVFYIRLSVLPKMLDRATREHDGDVAD